MPQKIIERVMNEKISILLDDLLQSIAVSNYSVKGINCLLPYDTSEDIKKLIPKLLNELNEQFLIKEYDSYKFGYFLSDKFVSYPIII